LPLVTYATGQLVGKIPPLDVIMFVYKDDVVVVVETVTKFVLVVV